ncbi:PAS domain-containing protein [Gilvibacter sediminis]|uniref:PAS domain-containing protein n=1 Tax=Gilvibacter sediminis TaxID=379071 RepID=UPI0023501681|nr:PAS domain-containing protein [Gilvibacter sediminis]MDC7998946.1 PAS domain-containing protein [Gilvibacter sediminis]
MKSNLTDLSTLDLFLSGLSTEEYTQLKPNLLEESLKAMPLLSWDLFMSAYQKQLTQAQKRAEVDKVFAFAKKFKWQADLDLAFAENDYEALIITDKDQNIIWVNDGFTVMTGYEKSYAISKTPRFLQGASTSVATKNRIRKKLKANKPFSEVIVNHRKDRSPYKCEVKIIPLVSETTTHYIAFEKAVV